MNRLRTQALVDDLQRHIDNHATSGFRTRLSNTIETDMNLFRPDVERIEGYVPGEQPQESGWIKLNTNENPYPPSPRVVAAIKQAAEGRLNVYPDPLVSSFRKVAAALFDVDPEWILPANGSDENLTILMRSFVDPGQLVAYPYPSYVLYETLADIQGARHERIPLQADWQWQDNSAESIIRDARLVLIPNPNSPSGTLWPRERIVGLLPPEGVLVLDEAYGDFADQPHRGEVLRTEAGRRIVITRTLSKSYSLAGLRFGFCVAHPELILGMRKVKDSYNCDTLAIAAATAAIEDQTWMQTNTQRIRATRQRLASAMQALGFQVEPSQANFVWAQHPTMPHAEIYELLKQRRILIRYMKFPGADPESPEVIFSGLRVTVGTDAEIDTFLEHLQVIVG